MDDQMLSQFKDMAELTEYASAQYQTILELSRNLQAAKEELSRLQGVVAENGFLAEVDLIPGAIPNEKIIAEIQLSILKNKAMAGGGTELTAEEARKTETYAKILANLRSGEGSKKPAETDIGKISNVELLAQLKALPSG